MNVTVTPQEYVSEEVLQSHVTQYVFLCRPRNGRQDDILLVKRRSLVLLCQKQDSLWASNAERSFQHIVRHAQILKRPDELDLIVISACNGAMYFIAYKDSTLEIIREIPISSLSSNTLMHSGFDMSFDSRGRAMCSLAREDELTIYKFQNSVSSIDLIARRKFTFPGFLLKSCFLSRRLGRDVITAVLHTSYKSTCRLVLLHWRQDETLDTIYPREMPLPEEMKLCLYMLPLTKRRGSFLHITPSTLSLISEDHVQCGDLTFDSIKYDIGDSLVSAATVLDQGEEDEYALVACDDSSVYLVTTNAYGRLHLESLGRLSFPATALTTLEYTKTVSDSWTIFATGDNGDAGVFRLSRGSMPITQITYIEAAPVTDLLLCSSYMSATTNKVLTIGGYESAGTMTSHLYARGTTVHHEVLVTDPTTKAFSELFFTTDRLATGFILHSLPWSSQLLEIFPGGDGELYDVSEDFGLVASTPTLLLHGIDNHFIQVTAKAIYRCSRSQHTPVVVFTLCDQERILLAQAVDSRLVLIVQIAQHYILKVITLLKDEDQKPIVQQLGPHLVFEAEPTSLKIGQVPSDSGILIMVACTDGRLVLAQNNWDESDTIFDYDLRREGVLADASSIPHDCHFLVDNSRIHILVSTRSGGVIYISYVQSHILAIKTVELGVAPTKFQSKNDANNEVLFFNERLGLARIEDDSLIIDYIEISGDAPGCVLSTRDPFFDPQHDTIRQSGILYLRKGLLSFATISGVMEHISRRVDLGQTPRRLLRIEDLDCDVIATNTPSRRLRGSDECSSGANLCVIKKGRCISEFPISDTKKHVPIFKDGDTIYALTQWNVIIAGKERSWTIVGSSRKNSKTNLLEGRLTVLRLKVHGMQLEVRKEFSPSFEEPIYALCPFGELSLIVAHGTVLELSTLDIESRSLATLASIKLRSAIISVYVTGMYIFAAVQKDSAVVLKYIPDEKRLIRVTADPVPRLSVSISNVDNHRVVLSDKLKNLVVYGWDPVETKLSTQSVVSLPTVITKAQTFFIKPDPLDGESTVRCLIPDDVVVLAAGIDGSIHSVFRLHPELLALLQSWRERKNQGFWRPAPLPELMASTSDDEMQALLTLVNAQSPTDVARLRQLLVGKLERMTIRLLAF